jgi:hypothetical protein
LEDKARELEIVDLSEFLTSGAFAGSGFTHDKSTHTITFTAA